MSEPLYPVGDDPTPDELLLRLLCAEREQLVMRRSAAEAQIMALDEKIAALSSAALSSAAVTP